MWMCAGIRRAGDGYGVCENGSMHRTAPAEPGRAETLSVDFAEHVAMQAESNRQTLEQLKELQKRTAEIEEQPRRRWEQVLGIIVNWATLALLGLLAAKIGL